MQVASSLLAAGSAVGVLGASVTAGSIIFRTNRTVPAGHVGILFERNAPYVGYPRDPVTRVPTPGVWYVRPGQILWWMVPGLHTLPYVKVSDCATENITIALSRTDGAVWLTRIVMNYDVNLGGVFTALTQAVGSFDNLVSLAFHDLVSDVIAGLDGDVTHEVIRQQTLARAKESQILRGFGVVPKWIAIPEMCPAPMTQIADAVSKLLFAGKFVGALGPELSAMLASAATAVTTYE